MKYIKYITIYQAPARERKHITQTSLICKVNVNMCFLMRSGAACHWRINTWTELFHWYRLCIAFGPVGFCNVE